MPTIGDEIDVRGKTGIRDLHFGKNQAIMTKECKRLHRVDVEESYDCKAVTESWWVV